MLIQITLSFAMRTFIVKLPSLSMACAEDSMRNPSVCHVGSRKFRLSSSSSALRSGSAAEVVCRTFRQPVANNKAPNNPSHTKRRDAMCHVLDAVTGD